MSMDVTDARLVTVLPTASSNAVQARFFRWGLPVAETLVAMLRFASRIGDELRARWALMPENCDVDEARPSCVGVLGGMVLVGRERTTTDLCAENLAVVASATTGLQTSESEYESSDASADVPENRLSSFSVPQGGEMIADACTGDESAIRSREGIE